MPNDDPAPELARDKFRRTLLRVMVVQVVALAVLGILQLRYHL
jgi:hypothetical protein